MNDLIHAIPAAESLLPCAIGGTAIKAVLLVAEHGGPTVFSQD